MTKQILRSTLTLVFWAIGLQGVAFVIDAFDSTLTHPVWDPTYNWLPFLGFAVASALAVSLLRAYAPRFRRPAVFKEARYSVEALGTKM